MRRFIAFGPALVVLLTAVVTLVAAPAAVRLIGYANTETNVRLAVQTLDDDNILDRLNKAARAVADSVEPSVVHIAVDEPAGRGRWIHEAQGSGWVFDTKGHVVTNAHVVRGASHISVQFQDGRTVDADVVGHDSTTDVAVIQVKANEGLFPVRRATGEELHQGERVYAFGSPFGFKFSMSEGIVSGLGRDPLNVIGQGGYTNFIQTDAAVNPGNSGGPLVDVHGRLVGMNVAIATANNADGSSEGQSAGISFAIPLPTIESVVDQLITTGVVTKGYLGIQHTGDDDKNNAALAALGFRGRGVVVKEVPADGPAGKVGILPGDVITRLNDEQVTGVPSLRTAIATNQPGDTIKVEVWRSGKTIDFQVTLSNLPPTPIDRQEAAQVCAAFGIRDIAETTSGALVIAQVVRDSAAATAGFRPGQTVVKVQNQPVSTLLDFYNACATAGLGQGRPVSIVVANSSGTESKSLTINPRQ